MSVELCAECGAPLDGRAVRGMHRRCYRKVYDREVANGERVPRRRDGRVLTAAERLRAETERKRLWEQEHRRQCPRCGGLKGVGAYGSGVCGRCRREEQRAAKEARWAVIAELYVSGWTREQVAEAVGTTANAVGTALAYMRKAGWDVPIRHGPTVDWREVSERAVETRLARRG